MRAKVDIIVRYIIILLSNGFKFCTMLFNLGFSLCTVCSTKMFTDQGSGVLTQPRQVLVGRRQHRVPPRLVEVLHRGDVSEESLVTPGLQQFVCDHLAEGRGVQNTHLQILQGHLIIPNHGTRWI